MIKFKIFVTIIVAALFIAPMTGFGADPASKPVVAVTPVNISPAEAEDVAALIKDLGSKDNSIRSRALENLSKLGARGVPPIIEAFMNTNSLVRKGAAEVLGNIGNVAPEVVTALVKALLDRDAYVRKSASDALGKIGAPVIPDIMKMLTDNDSNARKGAAEALGNIGNVTPAVAPNLIKTLEDVDGSVRKSAVEALGRIGSATPEVIPALISKVEDPDSNVRKSVAESLEKLNAMTAELKIKYCMLDLGDDNGDVRKRAVDVLSKVDPVTPEVTAAIIKALEDKDYSVRKSSAEYLEKRGAMTAALKATRHIIDLKSGNNAVRIRAAEALGNIGATTSEVIPALINALEDKDVRDAAIEALGNIGASAKSAVPALIKALADGDSNVRMMSAEALGKIGPSAKSAVPTLIKVLKDSDSAVREKAADALKKIGEMTLIRKVTYSIFTNPFITVLTIIGVCVALFFAAWYMTPLIWRIFLPLGWYMRELHNLNDKRRSAAVQALAKIGKPAVPALINVLKHKNKNIRISAATALNKIGLPLSQKEVPVVLEALRDKEREVRKNITEILGNAGPVTVEVIPALIKVLEDGDG
ncbi:MAG: HEAT repeat domain-containing protein, partial [Lentisphaerota bacterium]